MPSTTNTKLKTDKPTDNIAGENFQDMIITIAHNKTATLETNYLHRLTKIQYNSVVLSSTEDVPGGNLCQKVNEFGKLSSLMLDLLAAIFLLLRPFRKQCCR